MTHAQPWHRTPDGGLAPGPYPSKEYAAAARDAYDTGRAVPYSEPEPAGDIPSVPVPPGDAVAVPCVVLWTCPHCAAEPGEEHGRMCPTQHQVAHWEGYVFCSTCQVVWPCQFAEPKCPLCLCGACDAARGGPRCATCHPLPDAARWTPGDQR